MYKIGCAEDIENLHYSMRRESSEHSSLDSNTSLFLPSRIRINNTPHDLTYPRTPRLGISVFESMFFCWNIELIASEIELA